MMMMSDPAFILMKTGTLEVINRIWDFRKITGLPLFFTLDAGATYIYFSRMIWNRTKLRILLIRNYYHLPRKMEW
jgi:mevalonate pyrophosphate decarboxylase